MRLILFLYLFVIYISASAFEKPLDFINNTSDIKALIFLSKDCPCSRSHVDHLNQLQKDFKNVAIYGVISDPIKASEKAAINTYFSVKNFSFPIIADEAQELVKQFKALKTPHTVLLKKQPNGQYTTLYEGGVTDHRDGGDAQVFFLKENLQALMKNAPLPYAKGKSLGCYIRRI